MVSKITGAGAAVSVNRLYKSYGSVIAVDEVSIDVAPGEFVALLGPSGSGKTTILMSIAGFEIPNAGDVFLDGCRINDLPPHRRGIGVVFQRYALFPHLTVAENVAYPLRRRHLDRSSIEREVRHALHLVRLEGLGPRYPSQLSGGQQQRVALARALVFHPPVLLMDEPLGALDRKLRQQMQMEVKLLHRKIGTTIIFVTHDQEEALSMADRIAVLHQGRLQQVGSPHSLYDTPSNAFVANFIGETNFLPAEVVDRSASAVRVGIANTSLNVTVPQAGVCTDDAAALLGVRPEHLHIVERGQGLAASVVETAYAGSTLNVFLSSGPYRLTARVPTAANAVPLLPGTEVGLLPEGGACRIYSRADALATGDEAAFEALPSAESAREASLKQNDGSSSCSDRSASSGHAWKRAWSK